MTDQPHPPADLAAFLELASRATEGPWQSEDCLVLDFSFGRVADCGWEDEGLEPGAVDAEFIAAARTVAPEAARRALAAEARVQELEEELRQLRARLAVLEDDEED